MIKWRVSSQNGLYPFWSIWDIWKLSCWNNKIIRKFVILLIIPLYIMRKVSLESVSNMALNPFCDETLSNSSSDRRWISRTNFHGRRLQRYCNVLHEGVPTGESFRMVPRWISFTGELATIWICKNRRKGQYHDNWHADNSGCWKTRPRGVRMWSFKWSIRLFKSDKRYRFW